jgi:natural product biosynthesis luciferase-like monooxygenase protein
MDFSLFYFASAGGSEYSDKYRLLIEGAKFADTHGFAAVWTPERHFHEFGGLYPNPSVTSAAIATVTERIQIRAGSVVLPLHDPLLVAEEWAVVDNLSNGRVGVSFASGWHANDFVIAPENYANRREIMFHRIEAVRRLWRGENVRRRDGDGTDIEVRIRPRPIQRELPIWVTAAGSPETFRLAGEIGANLLTNLLGQSIEQLAGKIAIYRSAWREHGYGPGTGCVALMLHAFVWDAIDAVREKVQRPFINYLRSSADLWLRSLLRSLGQDIDAKDFTAEDLEALLSHAFSRYFETSGLFGTPSTCLPMINRLKSIGVDEVACLIDFGIDFDSVISSLHYLNTLRERSNAIGQN